MKERNETKYMKQKLFAPRTIRAEAWMTARRNKDACMYPCPSFFSVLVSPEIEQKRKI